MNLAVMQPYFLPYIGYYQLIAAVDVFVVYDNIKYTKKGWINRNRMLLNGGHVMFTLPLRKDSDKLDILQRELASEFSRTKLINKIKGAYSQAPFFENTLPLLERIVQFSDCNLSSYLNNSLIEVCSHLAIHSKILSSSAIDIDHGMKGQDKVIALCKALGASTYINAINGTDFYSPDTFKDSGVTLRFLKSNMFEYPQLVSPFVPWLSIVDVLMFNSLNSVKKAITNNYELI